MPRATSAGLDEVSRGRPSCPMPRRTPQFNSAVVSEWVRISAKVASVRIETLTETRHFTV